MDGAVGPGLCRGILFGGAILLGLVALVAGAATRQGQELIVRNGLLVTAVGRTEGGPADSQRDHC